MSEDKTRIFTLNDGRKLGYIEYGEPNGIPIFYFHGWPGSRYSAKETEKAAIKLGARVISTDRPGIGTSTFQKKRSLLDWPNDVLELADYLIISKFSVLGVSGGGPYSAACAYKIPNRLFNAGIVVGLAPVHIKGNLDGIPFINKLGWANYHKSKTLRHFASLAGAIEFKYFPAISTLIAFRNKQDKALYNEIMKNRKEDENTLAEAFRQGVTGPAEELRIYSDNWGFDLKDIRTKVYLWYGEKDKCVSVNMGRYYRKKIPKSEIFIDPNGGHLARYNYEEKIIKQLIN